MSSVISPDDQINFSANVTVVQFAFFAVKDQAGSLVNERLKELATAGSSSILFVYDVSSGIIHTRSSISNGNNSQFPNILQIYRDEMYARRIAPFARKQRFGQMYQLEPIALMGLSKNNTIILEQSERIIAHPIISVTNLGVACIQLWLQLPRRWKLFDIIPFSDPSQLEVSNVEYRLTLKNISWVLHRHNISILNIMSFIATQLLCELGAIKVDINLRRSEIVDWQEILGKASYQSADKSVDLPNLEYIETYPFYHFDLHDNPEKSIGRDQLKLILKENQREFRAFISKDINWVVKRNDMVELSLKKAECTTRDSILWYVASQGGIKAYCEELETDIYTSMVLASFEIELLLCMRYFLEKINYSLNEVTFEKTNPQMLARIHKKNIERLDSFFSLATCTKDTTASRLERLKDAFGITHLSNTTAEKIKALSELVTTYNNERIQKYQTLLTVLFGIFGVGSITASFFIWYYSSQNPPENRILFSSIGFTLLSMITIGLIIYLIGIILRRN